MSRQKWDLMRCGRRVAARVVLTSKFGATARMLKECHDLWHESIDTHNVRVCLMSVRRNFEKNRDQKSWRNISCAVCTPDNATYSLQKSWMPHYKSLEVETPRWWKTKASRQHLSLFFDISWTYNNLHNNMRIMSCRQHDVIHDGGLMSSLRCSYTRRRLQDASYWLDVMRTRDLPAVGKI